MNTLADADAREQALDPRQSFIVQAPAGSGKTELLTQRYLVLLNHVNAPEEILAITFTKKSAHEMRTRIINTLKNAALTNVEPESLHAKKTWRLAKNVLRCNDDQGWNLIENPNRLRIQTIDSFNASLTKHLPILSQFGASPTITDQPLSMYQEATQDLLSYLEENTPWSNAIAKLLLHMDNDPNKLQFLLINMLSKRDQWIHHIQFDSSDYELRSNLELGLKNIIIDTLSQLSSAFPEKYRAELMRLIRFAAENLQVENINSKITCCATLAKFPGASLEDLSTWLGIAEFALTNENAWRKRLTVREGFPAGKTTQDFKIQALELLEALSQYDDVRLLLEEIRLLPSPIYSENQWEILQALYSVLPIALATLRIVFQKYGKIDYIENALAALNALGNDQNPTDIALALDYRLRHILVDEFQDTANLQYQLLKKLTLGWEPNDGRTLFVVGDPMQSIYRFREAEVGLFIRARKKGIGQIQLKPLILSVNFRSCAAIVDWVNKSFKQVFPSFENIANGAVSYSPSTANKEDSNYSGVELHLCSNQNALADQASKIVSLIHEAKLQYPNGKIAILVRTRTHLKAIIPVLKKAGLAFRAIKIDPLNLRPVIQDLMALTRALLHPVDRIAWLALLRAPWCGLALSDLLAITGEDFSVSLWQNLQTETVLGKLSQDGYKRIRRIVPILKEKIAERRRESLRSWIESTWILLGGPACVESLSDLEDAAAYFDLLDQIDDGGTLTDLESLGQSVTQLFAAPDKQADENLQIMTIHNAKGLEFDTVILPHLERRTSGDEKQILLWMERTRAQENSDLVIAPVHGIGHENDLVYEYIKRHIQIKSSYEDGRLLYVAATRAKEKLHLLFSVEYKQTKTGFEPAIPAHSLLSKLWLAIQNDIIFSSANQHFVSNQVASLQTINRLISDWDNPIRQAQQPITTYHQNSNSFTPFYNYHQIIGTFFHQFLQLIAKSSLAWWRQKPISQQHQFIKIQLIQAGLQQSDLSKAIKTINQAIQHINQDPKAAWILTSHKEAQMEFPLTAVIENKVKIVYIDRTFIDEKGIRWIIDYKTSILTNADLEEFLNQEQEKYKAQLWEYHKIMRMMEARPIRIGLYFPMIPAWREWSFDEEMDVSHQLGMEFLDE